jgi:phytoene dehydrogenase-like protein
MDFTIAGGGLAGLTAAVALAKRGVRVELFEKRRELGGRAGSLTENGFTFNFGPHALYRSGVTMKTLSAWGIAPTGRVPDVSLLSPAEKWEFLQAYRKLTTQPPSSEGGL